MRRPTHQEMRIEVRRVRRRLHMSQRRFAGLFGFPLPTLLHWERGDRRPTGAARVLLQVIAQNPQVVLSTVRKTRNFRPWMLARFRHALSWRALPGMAVPHYP
jgi:transcriptional regulator with XRE-family HTH domain